MATSMPKVHFGTYRRYRAQAQMVKFVPQKSTNRGSRYGFIYNRKYSHTMALKSMSVIITLRCGALEPGLTPVRNASSRRSCNSNETVGLRSMFWSSSWVFRVVLGQRLPFYPCSTLVDDGFQDLLSHNSYAGPIDPRFYERIKCGYQCIHC